MGESTISRWKSAFDDLGIELNDTASPDDTDGIWFEALAEFSRHSFIRLLLSALDDQLVLRLEAALGPVEGAQKSLAKALTAHLEDASAVDWSLHVEDTPWILESSLSTDDEEHLRRVLLALLAICERFESITSADQWFDVLGRSPASEPTPERRPATDADGDDASPFEEIGAESPTDQQATIEATAFTQIDDKLHVALGFRQVLAPRQIEALKQGLEHHLHAKFDVQVRPVDIDDRAELRMPEAARTVLSLEVRRGEFSDSLRALKSEVDGFLERLEKFSSFGVDLFEYLGVGETVFEDSEEVADADAAESKLSFRRRAPSEQALRTRAADALEEDGVVLDLGAERGTSTLEPKDYTDPRLQRDDADTPLVDIVLRHPGYSDRRIGQVLSILLSIDYHDAVDIADSAPCVIAWGLGQQRARSFKEVIESAGGKVLLVEPDTFGQA